MIDKYGTLKDSKYKSPLININTEPILVFEIKEKWSKSFRQFLKEKKSTKNAILENNLNQMITFWSKT